jgi:hypothetical protein
VKKLCSLPPSAIKLVIQMKYSKPLSMYTGFIALTSNQANYSHNRQSCVHSALANDTTSNTMEPSLISAMHYGCPTPHSYIAHYHIVYEKRVFRPQRYISTIMQQQWQLCSCKINISRNQIAHDIGRKK